MDETVVAFFEQVAPSIPALWSNSQKAHELAQRALEALGDLPELDIGEGVGVPQAEFDRAVEECFSFYEGEALAFLGVAR